MPAGATACSIADIEELPLPACFGQSVWRVERYLWLSSQSKLGVLLRANGLMYFARVALERCPVCSMMT